MSDDGFSDSSDESVIEIQIKTLMGTTLDIKVHPRDTVADIKKKIFRVEGISVQHQNLVFRSQELKDSLRLCDCGIQNGSTLTLVTNVKGGPISTRRLALSFEHHVFLKELKNLLENSREDLVAGSKVSVLVFKEGEIINLLRVIENEDGSYTPYSENPISPPSKPVRRDPQMSVFQRLVEDTRMSSKIEDLRKKMTMVSEKRQNKGGKPDQGPSFDQSGPTNSAMGIFERSLDEETQSESEEVALKDKHRIKPKTLQPIRPRALQPIVPKTLHPPIIKNHPPPPATNSLYSQRRGSYSHTKQNYTWMQRKWDSRLFDGSNSRERSTASLKASSTSQLEGARLQTSNSMSSVSGSSLLSPLDLDESTMDDIGAKFAEQIHLFDDDNQNLYGEGTSSFPMSASSRLRLTRLVLSEGAKRPKSSPESVDLEEHPPDFWEINEPASERLKRSATCKVGLLNHKIPEYNYDHPLDRPSTSKIKSEISGGGGGNYSKASTTDYGVCSGANYFVPQFMSAPSAIPPQYAPKQPNYCDLYFRNGLGRSPLYSRSDSKKESEETLPDLNDPEEFQPPAFLADCSSIKRLQNNTHPSSTTSSSGTSFTPSAISGQNRSFNNNSSSSIRNTVKKEVERIDNINTRLEKTIQELTSSTNLRLESTKISSNHSSVAKSEVLRSKDVASMNGEDNSRLENHVFGPKSDFLNQLGWLSADILRRSDTQQEEPILPPVITKKKSRCSECNKRLNITNIYNCRCGRIFCSQHRYSEVHRCTYDYKTEGRKILEHQNPLVTAEKIKRI